MYDYRPKKAKIDRRPLKDWTDLEIIALMRAHIDGAPIERYRQGGFWEGGFEFPDPNRHYRVFPSGASIDWESVPKKYNFLMMNADDRWVLSTKRPRPTEWAWEFRGETIGAEDFPSFQPGRGCYWWGSVVERPAREKRR